MSELRGQSAPKARTGLASRFEEGFPARVGASPTRPRAAGPCRSHGSGRAVPVLLAERAHPTARSLMSKGLEPMSANQEYKPWISALELARSSPWPVGSAHSSAVGTWGGTVGACAAIIGGARPCARISIMPPSEKPCALASGLDARSPKFRPGVRDGERPFGCCRQDCRGRGSAL
jgi:hypothetical protein